MAQTTVGSTERNAQIALRFLEMMDRHQFDAVEAMMTPDFQLHFSGQQLDLDQTRVLVRSVYESFGDFRHDVQETLAVDDRVVMRMILRATHTGPFEGVPPTGRQIEVGQISMLRITGDKVSEIREEADMLLLMQQIGAIPAGS